MINQALVENGTYTLVEKSELHGRLALPALEITSRTEDLTVEVLSCTIHDGNYDGYLQHPDSIHPTEGGCEKRICKEPAQGMFDERHGAIMCQVPTGDLEVTGVYGEPDYSFVKINVWVDLNTTGDIAMSLSHEAYYEEQGFKSTYISTHGGNPSRVIREISFQDSTLESFQSDISGLAFFVDLAPKMRSGAYLYSYEDRADSLAFRDYTKEPAGLVTPQKMVVELFLKVHPASITWKERPQLFLIEASIEIGGLFVGLFFFVGFLLNALIDCISESAGNRAKRACEPAVESTTFDDQSSVCSSPTVWAI